MTWEEIENQLIDAAVQVRPLESPRMGYWHSSPGATLAMLAYANRRSVMHDAPLEVRREIYLRFLCAIDWVRTYRDIAQAPDYSKYPDFLGWLLCTLWSAEGAQWMEKSALTGKPIPSLFRVRKSHAPKKSLFSGMLWFLADDAERASQVAGKRTRMDANQAGRIPDE